MPARSLPHLRRPKERQLLEARARIAEYRAQLEAAAMERGMLPSLGDRVDRLREDIIHRASRTKKVAAISFLYDLFAADRPPAIPLRQQLTVAGAILQAQIHLRPRSRVFHPRGRPRKGAFDQYDPDSPANRGARYRARTGRGRPATRAAIRAHKRQFHVWTLFQELRPSCRSERATDTTIGRILELFVTSRPCGRETVKSDRERLLR